MTKQNQKELENWLKKMESKLKNEITTKTYLLKLVEREQEALEQLKKAEMTTTEEKKG